MRISDWSSDVCSSDLSWNSVCAARRRASSSSTACAIGSRPRRASPLSNSAGWSRMNLRSCMKRGLGRATVGRSGRTVYGTTRPGVHRAEPTAANRSRLVRRLRFGLFVEFLIQGRFALFPFALHEPGAPDGNLVEQDDGNGETDLAQWIGRRQDGGGNEGDDDGVTSLDRKSTRLNSSH